MWAPAKINPANKHLQHCGWMWDWLKISIALINTNDRLRKKSRKQHPSQNHKGYKIFWGNPNQASTSLVWKKSLSLSRIKLKMIKQNENIYHAHWLVN